MSLGGVEKRESPVTNEEFGSFGGFTAAGPSQSDLLTPSPSHGQRRRQSVTTAELSPRARSAGKDRSLAGDDSGANSESSSSPMSASLARKTALMRPRVAHQHYDDNEKHRLTASQRFEGFSYLLKHQEGSPYLESLRTDLFPALAHALEVVLEETVNAQIERELHNAKEQAAAAARREAQQFPVTVAASLSVSEARQAQEEYVKGKVAKAKEDAAESYVKSSTSLLLKKGETTLRAHARYPTEMLSTSPSAPHPILRLAAELKKRSGGNDSKFDLANSKEGPLGDSSSNNSTRPSSAGWSQTDASRRASQHSTRPGSATQRTPVNAPVLRASGSKVV